MGYDLHVSRARFWPDSEQNPISHAELVAALRARPGWSPAPSTTGKVADLPRVFQYDDPVDARASLAYVIWTEGRITVSKPGEASLPELLTVAGSLGAMVIGDYDEIYLADGSVVRDE